MATDAGVHETFATRLGFLLAAVGSAVGIGNIWRFSSVVGQNGGGAYLIPFLLAVALFALPLMVLEIAVGRRLRGDVVTAFRSLGARYQILGWAACTVVFAILSYYLVVTGWTLAFLSFAAAGTPPRFGDFTATPLPILFFLLAALATGLVVSLGVRRGVERTATYLVPFAFVILAGLALFALTLPGAGEGLAFFLTPDFSVLGDPLLWGAAFGQAFFSLSVGFGVLITYGGYLERGTDVPRAAVAITLADLAVAFLAGLLIFPLVFTFGLEPTLGAELAFTTIPAAFDLLPGGRFLGAAFFLLLFIAALTSAISMLELNVAALTRATGLSRRRASLFLTAGLVLLGLPSALSYSVFDLRFLGTRVLDLMDDSLGSFGLLVTALFISVAFAWRMDRPGLEAEVSGSRLWRSFVLRSTRYAIPPALLVLIVSRLVLDLDFPGWHWVPDVAAVAPILQGLLTLLLLAFLLALTLTAVRGLRALHRRALGQRFGGRRPPG